MFSLNHAIDLLEKCQRDQVALANCETHPEYDYVMFDAVLSLSHLFEWYLKDDSIPKAKRLSCIEIFNPFQSIDKVSADLKKYYNKIQNFPNPNSSQESIRLLCNKGKHFKKTTIEIQDRHLLSTCNNMYAGNVTAGAGFFKRYKYSVEIDGQAVDLHNVINDLLNQWITFAL
ncbi:MAG: hypothetical protein ABUK01_14505 [Leptospirales bacterium]